MEVKQHEVMAAKKKKKKMSVVREGTVNKD